MVFSRVLLSFVVFLIATPLAITGCDVIAGVAGVDTQRVSLGQFGKRIRIQGGEATAVSGTIGTEKLPNAVDGIDGFSLKPNHLVYKPGAAAAKTGGIQGSGTIEMVVVIDNTPAGYCTATIVDDVVTDIQPETIDVGDYEDVTIQQIYEAIPEDDRPILDDFQGLTTDEIEDQVNAALQDEGLNMTIMLSTTGDLNGKLSIQAIDVDFNL